MDKIMSYTLDLIELDIRTLPSYQYNLECCKKSWTKILIGWLFGPQMWEILRLPGASRTNVGRVTALRTFQIFLQKSVFIPVN